MRNIHTETDPDTPRPFAFNMVDNPSLLTLVERFHDLEMRCTQMIEELEDKAQTIIRRAGRNRAAPPIDPENFRRSAEQARRYHVSHRLLAGACFIEGATRGEQEELQELDDDLRFLQLQLSRLEEEILDAVPANAANAVAKLKFIATLLIGGTDVERGHFAYLVQECAEICAEDMQPLWQIGATAVRTAASGH